MVAFRVDTARRALYSGDMSTPRHHPVNPRGPAAVLTEDEIRAFLATFSRRSPTAVRNRALIMLLWRAGLRISEASALETRDLTLNARRPTVRVRHGKGGQYRTVGLQEEAVGAIELWLAERRRLGLAHYPIVFCTLSSNRRGGRFGGSYVRAMITRKAQQAGLGRVHPHAFRATLAVEMHREGKPLAAIRDVLGHSNIATTDAYLRRVFPEDAIDAVIDR